MEKKTKELTDEEIQKNIEILRYAERLKGIVSSNLVTKEMKKPFSNKFTSDNVGRYLEDPMKYEKELRQLSTVLMTLSPQYQQIVNYFPSICKFIPIVYPNMAKYNGDKIKDKMEKDYLKAIGLMENMNIEHEFQKIATICSMEDVFYGYIYETNDSFFIQQMDSDYCRISSCIDGSFAYQFSFKYFDKMARMKAIEGGLIETYPSEFQEKYNLYLSNKTDYEWQELNYENSICIKMLPELPFVFPTFCSLFDDLADLSKYKELNKNKTQIDNYKFIGMELPISEKSGKVDDFLVDPDTALAFYNMLLATLPDGIGAFISATPFKEVNFNSNSIKEGDSINIAENNIFSSIGVSSSNFGKNATSSTALKSSNTVDSARMFKLYRQFERWLNLRLKKKLGNKFKAKLLDVTAFNIQEEIDKNLKLSQYGVPNKIRLAALLGMSQSEQMAMNILEEDILNLTETWKPLNSSHTQSQKETGKSEETDKEISDAGEKTKDRDDNVDKD